MKKLRVKVRKRASIVINYDIKKISTEKGIYLFDDIKFEYICNCHYQYLHILIFGVVVTTLRIKTTDFIGFNYKGKFECAPANRNLEYFIYKYRQLLKGGE